MTHHDQSGASSGKFVERTGILLLCVVAAALLVLSGGAVAVTFLLTT